MSTPTVSIGLPVHNGLPYLREAILSLLNQTFVDFELIISDNASEDGTLDVCEEFAQRDGRIRILRNAENHGAAENYNRLVHTAKGRYFKWAANDDVCLPTYLERCVEVLQGRPEVVLCYPKTQLIDAQGLPIRNYQDNMHFDESSAARRLRHVIRSVRKANCVFGVIRTESLRRTNLIGRYRASDYVLLAELAMLGCFYETPERLFLRRIHEMQSGEGKSNQEIADWFHPRTSSGGTYPIWRLLGEHVRAVHRSPQPRTSRLACYFQLVHLLRKYRSALVREMVQAAQRSTRLCTSWPVSGNMPVGVQGKERIAAEQ